MKQCEATVRRHAELARSPPLAAYKICRVATPEAHHSSLITHHFPDNNRRRQATPCTHISFLISHLSYCPTIVYMKLGNKHEILAYFTPYLPL